ncbi:hypothetical protein [Loktanella sp. Alg231-35]|uniref:hypothetical protein n=1 Tax=Loktanella sp. Alg231-35 TaxID=1922220 RepID=UPI000D54CB55|nr:hypothetical protein [Loktanella sp. Alg231-35]
MYKTTTIAALAIASFATPTIAQDINAASVSAAYTSYTDDNFDSSFTNLEAGIEVGLASAFAIGGNLAVYGGDLDDGAANATVHGMYMMSPDTALGGFVGLDSKGDFDATLYGIEFGTGSESTRAEAYYGVIDSDDLTGDFSVAGFSFEFAIAPSFTLGIGYEAFTIADGFTPPGTTVSEDLTYSDTSLIARYLFEGGTSVFAEIGQVGFSAATDDTLYVSANDLEYFAIGAEYAFGRATGTLLGERTFVGWGL